MAAIERKLTTRYSSLRGEGALQLDVEKAKSALTLFLDKLDRLERSEFVRSILEDKASFKMTWDHELGGSSQRTGPGEEAIDAFVLTVRFFVQDNEPTSLRRMSDHFETLVDAGLLPVSVETTWTEARDAVNGFLDQETFLNESWERDGIEIGRETYTNRRIMEIFIYGGLAHSNAEKKARFDNWRSMPWVFPMYEFQFVNVLASLVLTLREIGRLVVGPAVFALQSSPPASGAKS